MQQPTFQRRTFLRGSGVALALPMLECHGAIGEEASGSAPVRMIAISNNLGVLPKPFFPSSTGGDYELTPYLQELEEFRNDFTIFSGLSHPDVVGGHSTENCFLTAARGPTRSGFRNQISLDQFAAESLGQQTRFPTLNLGVNIEKGKRSLSWTRDGSLLPAEDRPSALFEKLFVQGDRRAVERRLSALRRRRSILDVVAGESRAIAGSLGAADRRRLDQYLSSIRQLEQRLLAAGEWEQLPKPKVDRDPPEDILDESRFFDKFELMLSMAALALQTDSTRIVTLMLDAYETGVFQIDAETRSLNGYHNLSHHGHVPEKLQQLEIVDRRQMRILTRLLQRLAETSDGQQRLLDNTMVLYGSNMGDANTHDNSNLPILLAGGGFRHGRHVAFDTDNNLPLSNLFLTMLHRMGVEADRFGSSTGTIDIA